MFPLENTSSRVQTFSQHSLTHFPTICGLRPLVIQENASTYAKKRKSLTLKLTHLEKIHLGDCHLVVKYLTKILTYLQLLELQDPFLLTDIHNLQIQPQQQQDILIQASNTTNLYVKVICFNRLALLLDNRNDTRWRHSALIVERCRTACLNLFC